MSFKWLALGGTLPAVLLCLATPGIAQEEPKPAAHPEAAQKPAHPKTPPPAARTATPPAKTAAAKSALPALPARAGASAPHANVETTQGGEKRAEGRSKPAATTASPTTEPPR